MISPSKASNFARNYWKRIRNLGAQQRMHLMMSGSLMKRRGFKNLI